MLPYWYDAIVPDLMAGRSVLVTAHGNSLRALVKHLDGISDDAIASLNIPTGIPLVYELDGDMRPMRLGWSLSGPRGCGRCQQSGGRAGSLTSVLVELVLFEGLRALPGGLLHDPASD